MSYNVMGINPGHNGSAALVIDGKTVYYCEEERISRQKYDGNPFRAMLHILENYEVDEIVIGGTSATLPILPWTMEDPYTALARKFNSKIKSTNYGSQHHVGHAASAFYNSGFTKATAIIIDGAGSLHTATVDDTGNTVSGYETESVYQCGYPSTFTPLYKRYADGNAFFYRNNVQDFDNSVTLTKAFEAVSQYLGFGFIEAGKTMGLAPYGRSDPLVPDIFVEGRGNKNLLIPRYPGGALIDTNRFPALRQPQSPSNWHHDFSKIADIEKNIAWKIQQETQKLLGDLIQSVIDATGENTFVIAGGYGLNCVANYYLKGRFPNIELFIDPVSHDGGTAIGLAKLAWHIHSKSIKPNPLDTLYLGTELNYESMPVASVLNAAGLTMIDVTPTKVAALIADGNIVAMIRGKAEAGPRALGNRSILFDPRKQDGKDYVNKVKGREWFRPFAGSVIADQASNWFDLKGLQWSPYMMYAVDLQPSKIGSLPAITHVDGTCRIQTVTPSENPDYYELILEFNKLTGVPVLFNTSFNLAGEPLVDSIDDALHTILKCDIKYLYLPEISKLITK